MDETEEMKESLKGMIKSNDIADLKLAIEIVSGNEEFKDMWYNIKDYISKDTVRYIELYSKEGGSDKVYLIVLNKTLKNSRIYGMMAYYGRRGKTMRSDDKGECWNGHNMDHLMNEKINKGYKLINDIKLK